MKNRLYVFIIAIGTSLTFQSCEELGIFDQNQFLTNDEIITGLREALMIGTDTAVSKLNAADGFFGDEVVKILLPEEAQPVYDVVKLLPTNIVENTILSINRAAEDAAKEAGPIFVDAIVDMTIEDGLGILHGNDTAATTYLRSKTQQQLFDAFQPKIEASLSKKLVLNYSAEELYSKLISAYNTASLGGFLFDEISTNSLSEHTTSRALRGLFIKVGDEEKLIRENPAHRVTELLEKVFAEQD
ncbi:MAG: DUF4197 domain-containing protein [Flavobacteriales bacterium]